MPSAVPPPETFVTPDLGDTSAVSIPELTSTWIVIAAYNEGPMIADTVAGVRRFFDCVVVVDDCSADDTADRALGAGANVCRHVVNLGQGAALQTGIAYALARGASAVVTFDADGQHDPADAKAMADLLSTGRYDVVLASRFRGHVERMPVLRKAVLQLAVLFTRITTGLQVTDTHNGLRAFTRAAALKIRIRQNRMAHASEILAEVGRLRLRWTEVPGTVTYTSYSMAKGQRVTGALEILKDLLMNKLQS